MAGVSQPQWAPSDLRNLLKLVRKNDDELKHQAFADVNDNGLHEQPQQGLLSRGEGDLMDGMWELQGQPVGEACHGLKSSGKSGTILSRPTTLSSNDQPHPFFSTPGTPSGPFSGSVPVTPAAGLLITDIPDTPMTGLSTASFLNNTFSASHFNSGRNKDGMASMCGTATRQPFLSNATQWEFPVYLNHCQQNEDCNETAAHMPSEQGLNSMARGIDSISEQGVPQGIDSIASNATQWEWHCDGPFAKPPGITGLDLEREPYVAEDLQGIDGRDLHDFYPQPQQPPRLPTVAAANQSGMFDTSPSNPPAEPLFMEVPLPGLHNLGMHQTQRTQSQTPCFHAQQSQNEPQFQQPSGMTQAPLAFYQNVEQHQPPNAQNQTQCAQQKVFQFEQFQDQEEFDAMHVQDLEDMNAMRPLQGDGKEKTLMIRGIPCSLTQEEMMGMLDNAGFAGQYNFFYMPRFQVNLGYAFVNFVEASSAIRFTQVFDGTQLNPVSSEKVCTVSAAHIQGTAKLKKLFRRKRRRAPFFCDESKPDTQ